jgi:uncharacterized repeat protein (TIGR03803 family)
MITLKMRAYVARAMFICGGLALAACGGGGDAGGSGAGGASGSMHTIGGQLSGLSNGTPLTLLNNGSDRLTLRSNGSFAFSMRALEGATYGVTIDVQPPGANCSLTNGSGSVAGADVTNLNVTCRAQTYPVSGELSGLATGQQVTIQNNGTDPLTLTTNGQFTFSRLSDYNATYSVAVSSQPGQASSQYCSVNQGIGTIIGAVTNVLIACSTLNVLHNFTSANSNQGTDPTGPVSLDSSGNLWGTTGGGSAFFGVAFLLSQAGDGYSETLAYTFRGQPYAAEGIYPTGGLILDGAGNLYGTTSSGGADGWGVVFRLAPAAGGGFIHSTLHAFGGSTADGGGPVGSLVRDSAGNLYGTTRIGGTYQSGTVFRISPSSGGGYGESVLYSFTGDADGSTPEAGLTIDGAGNLYGTTSSSRTSGYFGAVFKLSPTGGGAYTTSILHTFLGSNGAAPRSALVMDDTGNLYGTTRLGSGVDGIGRGTVFKLTHIAGDRYNPSVIYSFRGGSDGEEPVAGLAIDSAGNLYGTTSKGGDSSNCLDGCGTVFKLTRASGYEKSILFSFTGGSVGSGPAASPVMDREGNLYGTTSSGCGWGASGCDNAGNVFKLILH